MPHTNKVEEIVKSIEELYASKHHKLCEDHQDCDCCTIVDEHEVTSLVIKKLTQALSQTRQETMEDCIAVLPEKKDMWNIQDEFIESNAQYNQGIEACTVALEQLKQNK